MRCSIICFALVVSVGSAVASNDVAKKKTAWTEPKAERLVLNGATARLPTEDRGALEEELRRAAALNLALAAESSVTQYGVGEVGGSVYLDRAYAYSLALSKVRRGLAIDTVDCIGSGVAVSGRFSTFRCSVTSESLELPPTLDVTPEVLPSTHVDAGGWSGSVSAESGIPISAGIPEPGMRDMAGKGEPPFEGQPRIVGPIVAELDVRVTGTSTFAYRKV